MVRPAYVRASRTVGKVYLKLAYLGRGENLQVLLLGGLRIEFLLAEQPALSVRAG